MVNQIVLLQEVLWITFRIEAVPYENKIEYNFSAGIKISIQAQFDVWVTSSMVCVTTDCWSIYTLSMGSSNLWIFFSDFCLSNSNEFSNYLDLLDGEDEGTIWFFSFQSQVHIVKELSCIINIIWKKALQVSKSSEFFEIKNCEPVKQWTTVWSI